jgi:hypothetical protein
VNRIRQPDKAVLFAVSVEIDFGGKAALTAGHRAFLCAKIAAIKLVFLGEAGSTKIAPDEDQRLKARWEKSDLWPRTAEGATSLVLRVIQRIHKRVRMSDSGPWAWGDGPRHNRYVWY